MQNTDQKMANGVQTLSKTKVYTEQQVIQLMQLKDHTLRWLAHEKTELEGKLTEMQHRCESVNKALNLIQSLTDSYMDLAVFERLKLS